MVRNDNSLLNEESIALLIGRGLAFPWNIEAMNLHLQVSC